MKNDRIPSVKQNYLETEQKDQEAEMSQNQTPDSSGFFLTTKSWILFSQKN